MGKSKYDEYIVTKLRNGARLPLSGHGEMIGESGPGGRERKEQVLWIDNEVVPGSFYTECSWFFPGQDQTAKQSDGAGREPHTHPFDEVIAFVGTNREDPHDLGGEIELWLENKQFVLEKSFLVHIPAGVKHCPLIIRRINSPIFHFALGQGHRYELGEGEIKTKMTEEDLARRFIFGYKPNVKAELPDYRGTDDKKPDDPKRHIHILYLDEEVVPKAKFYVEASWFWPRQVHALMPGEERGPKAHAHPFPEIITMIGTNPDDVHDLGGEIELWIEDEQHIINKSFVAFIPAGIVHCPLRIRRIDRSMFHFTAGLGAKYI
jgi:quercetin dioxygenase-like cupin family protein